MPRVSIAAFGCIGLAIIATIFPCHGIAGEGDAFPASRLETSTVPAVGAHDALLDIAAFGRYSVTVKSDQGTAIQLVDRMAGPGKTEGSAGHADGRVNAFLDCGQYKIKLFSDQHGSGDAALTLHPSTELNEGAQQLVELKPVDSDLGDHQQRSYWLNITERRSVAIEASGRYLDDLRLWRDGKWLVDGTPGTITAAPSSGQPLTVKQLSLALEPGLYRITAYGGEGQKWANESKASPLHIRFGIPKLAEAGRVWQVASPGGIDRFLVPGTATYFRLDIDKPEHAALTVQPYDATTPFAGGSNRVTVEKTSRDPFAETTTQAVDNAGYSLVTVQRQPGQEYKLTWFDNRDPHPLLAVDNARTGWAAMFQSGNDQDEIDPTIVVGDETDPVKGTYREPVVASTAIKIDKAVSWRRRFNLLDQTDLFLDVTEPVDLSVEGAGVDAQYRIQPLAADPNHPRGFQPSGYGWQMDPGFYILTMLPKEAGKGIMTLSLHAQGTPAPVAESPRQPAAMIAVPFKARGNYRIYLNSSQSGLAGVRLYNAPIDLAAGITFEMAGAQMLSLPVTAREAGKVTAIAEDGTALPVTLDDTVGSSVTEGDHTLALTMPAGNPRYVSVSFIARSLQGDTPLPPVDPKLLAGLPQFAAIIPGQAQFHDLQKDEHATYALQVAKPALYQLQSTGIIETEGTLRTRVVPMLDTERANGMGRNFLIQRYLGQGDYQLTVDAPGQSFGPIGLTLGETALVDKGLLQPDLWARTTLAPGEGASYRFHVDKAGTYTLKTMGLGRDFAMRLEDNDGWPLLAPGGPADITQDFPPGDYRMILLPGVVENRAVTLLHRVEPVVERSGHGPFPVTFGGDMTNRWLEPAKGETRSPDRWTFTLPAPAHVTIAIDSGMQAALSGSGEPRVALPAKEWKGLLAAGPYEVAVTSVGANNRVDYTLRLSSDELLASQSRPVTAPAEIPLSIGTGAPVEINSYGGADVRAQLYDQAGSLIAANDDRDNDWNFSIASPLAPGNYRLQVDPVGTDGAQTEVRLEQPAETTDAPANMDKSIGIADALVHVVPIDAAGLKANSLLVVAAQGSSPIGLALEASTDNSVWHGVGGQAGMNPFVGLPIGDKPPALRLRVWSRDHTTSPVNYSISDVMAAGVEEANLTGKGKALQAMEGPGGMGALHVALGAPGVLLVPGPSDGVQWSTIAGVATAYDATGQITAPGRDVWLVGRATQSAIVLRRAESEPGKPLQLTVPVDGLRLPAQPAPDDAAVLWKVASRGPGQAAVATESDDPRLLGLGGPPTARVAVTVALPGSGSVVKLSQPEKASRIEDLPVALTRYDFKLPSARPLPIGLTDGTFSGRDAARFNLPADGKSLSLNLPEGTAAVLTQAGKPVSVLWSWAARTLETQTQADGIVLLYTGKGHAAYSVAVQTDGKAHAWHDAAGTLVVDYRAVAAGTLSGLGAVEDVTVYDGTAAIRGKSIVTTGNSYVHAMVDYGPGAMAIAPDLASKASEDAKPIDLRSDGPQSLPLEPVVIAAGPARLIRVHADVPATLYQGGDTFDQIHPQLLQAGTDYFMMMPEGQPRDLMARAADPDAKGTMTLSVLTTTPIGEGLGPKRRIAPGEARAFSFSLPEARTVGVGVRASVDVANCYVVGPDGKMSALGKLEMPALPAGTSVLVVTVPASAEPVEIQPALIGAELPGKGPPADVKAEYGALINGKTK